MKFLKPSLDQRIIVLSQRKAMVNILNLSHFLVSIIGVLQCFNLFQYQNFYPHAPCLSLNFIPAVLHIARETASLPVAFSVSQVQSCVL